MKNVLYKFRPKTLRQGGSFEAAIEQNRKKQAKFRQNKKAITVTLTLAEEAVLMSLKKTWGIASNNAAFKAAILFLFVVTKLGLKRLDTDVFEALMVVERARQAENAQAMPPERDPT